MASVEGTTGSSNAKKEKGNSIVRSATFIMASIHEGDRIYLFCPEAKGFVFAQPPKYVIVAYSLTLLYYAAQVIAT